MSTCSVMGSNRKMEESVQALKFAVEFIGCLTIITAAAFDDTTYTLYEISAQISSGTPHAES